MAITPYGFDGSLDEAKWALMWKASTAASHVLGTTDWRVTAVAGYRQVNIAPGSAMSNGVLAVSDTGINLNLTAPSAGQWHLVVMAVDWNSNTVTPMVLPSTTTGASVPANIPTSFPTGFSTNPGATAHMPLAWVWTNASTTTLTLVDVRTRNPQYLNQGIWGQYGGTPQGPAAARDLWYNIWTNNASTPGQNYLQGAMWFNTDSERLERFYGVYNVTSNPNGAITPGWYPATSYDNDSGNSLSISSESQPSVRINQATSADFITYDVTVAIPTWVNVRADFNLKPNTSSQTANLAGSVEFALNGARIGGTKRYHTHGSYGSVWHMQGLYTRAYLKPGTNRITAGMYNEGGSGAAWIIDDAKMIVWKE